jgi:cytochrome P450
MPINETRNGTAIRRVTTPAGHPAWQVVDYDEVKLLLADPRLGRSHPDPENAPRLSSAAILGGPTGDPETEAEEHARMRRLLSPAFSARRMARLQPRIRQIVAELLDQMLTRTPPVDFHEAISFPLPALVICELLGVPFEDRERFRRWSDDAGHMTDPERANAGLQQLWEYMRSLVERKQVEPGEDVISLLVAAGREDTPDGSTMDVDGISLLAAGLLFAGHETTVTAIDRGMALLFANPDQRAELFGDAELTAGAVEEILRAAMPLPDVEVRERDIGLPRYANADIELGDVTIRAGDLVLLGLQVANRDENRFPQPEQFDVRRTQNPHLTFGYGPRFCLGAPLARLELNELFTALPQRCPDLRLAVPVEELRPRDEFLTGGLAELPVTWPT